MSLKIILATKYFLLATENRGPISRIWHDWIQIRTINWYLLQVSLNIYFNFFQSWLYFRDPKEKPSLDIYDLNPHDGKITATCQWDGVSFKDCKVFDIV